MKVVIDIKDKKAPFALELLRSLSFVKNVKPMSLMAAKLYNNLNEAAEQVRLHKQGKLQLKIAQELLNEL